MTLFKYKLVLEAKEEAQADKKIKALTVLASRLNERELEKLAHIVKYDPVKLAMAKAALGV